MSVASEYAKNLVDVLNKRPAFGVQDASGQTTVVAVISVAHSKEGVEAAVSVNPATLSLHTFRELAAWVEEQFKDQEG